MNTKFDALWDESPVDITKEANDIWSIANKLRNAYMPDHYGDVIIPMTVLRRLECTLEETKEQVVKKFEENPNYPEKALCRLSGFQFYNTSRYDLKELCNDPDALAENFKAYINALKNVRVNDPGFKAMVDKGKKETMGFRRSLYRPFPCNKS